MWSLGDEGLNIEEFGAQSDARLFQDMIQIS